MTLAQAKTIFGAFDAAKLPSSIVATYDAAGVPTYSIQLDTTRPYSHAQLKKIWDTADAQGLAVSAEFSAIGIA